MFQGFALNVKHIIILGAGLTTIVGCILFFGNHSSNDDSWISENASQPVDPVISTQLPYNEYLLQRQKAQELRDIKNGDYFFGAGVTFGYVLGTTHALMCDTCTLTNNALKLAGTQQFYITLPAWQLKQEAKNISESDSVTFYAEKGKSYLFKPVVDSAVHRGHTWYYHLHSVSVPVKFRYHREGNYVMIPVSKLTHQICTYMLYLFSGLFLCWFLFLIAEFLKFVIALSKGLAFTADNIRRLRLIGFGLISYPVISALLALLVWLIFSSYIAGYVTLNSRIYSDAGPALFTGIIFLLLYKAFKEGNKLKEENDLTV